MIRVTTTLLLLLALALPALAGAEVSNDDLKYDGIYQASVRNVTKKTEPVNLEVEIEYNNLILRFPEGHRSLRIQGMYDRRFQIEVTGRDRESGEIWVATIET